MLDLKNIDNDTLLIVNGSIKKDILLEISKNGILKNIKLMSFNEFIKEYLFDYNTKTIYYIMNKFKVKVDIALIYIRNLYYISDVNYTDQKLIFLKNLKEELLKENLLIINPLFKERIKTKNIVVYGDTISFERNILSNLSVTYIKNATNLEYKHDIYETKNIEEEVTFIASQIAELIDNGVPINNIKLANVSGDYKNIIRRVFSIFNIPVDLQDDNNLFGTALGQYFIEHLDSDINNTINKIKNKFNLERESINYLYNLILRICNKYNWCDDYLSIKDLLIYELKNTSIKDNTLFNKISLIDLENFIAKDEDYIFLIGFNQGIFPLTEKDEEYLNDELKIKIGLEDTVTRNILHQEKTLRFIKETKNLIITYPIYTSSEIEISNLNDILRYSVIKDIKPNYRYSNLNNKLSLGKMLDTYMKYGVKENNLDLLLNNYKDLGYRSYDNQFNGINLGTLNEFKKKSLTLSYSSIDAYFHCAFRFYISNILKLNIYEETFMNYIGSLFHFVLSEYYKDDFNFEISWARFLQDNEKELTKKEEFFLQKLKEELKFIISVLDEQKNYTDFKDVLLEESINIDKSNSIWNINFVGIVDKILSMEQNDQKLVSVVDYKTGNPSLDLTKLQYGMGMQLPIYLYLIKNKWNAAKIIGFYLQKIVPSIINRDPKKTYLDQKKDYLKLQGYSINKESLLSYFDNTYENSNLIKSMKTTSKGFSSYAKVLTEEEIESLNKLVDKNINIAIEKITSGDFKVNPKQIGGDLIGCEFCKFKDICFKNNKDIITLKEYKDLSFLGGDDYA